MSDDFVSKRYLDHSYLEQNPTWDSEDAPWKMARVKKILEGNNIQPKSICEVGCGSGAVLAALRATYPDVQLVGYDIAPDAKRFWKEHVDKNIDFHIADFIKSEPDHYDILLILDVLEHVSDPHTFLNGLKAYSDYIVIHFPLDLSALSILRETPLLHVRRKVGHLHYFTKGLALELLDECGFEVIDSHYTGAAISSPQRKFKSRLFGRFRQLICFLNKDIGVRLLGGETLMVLAKNK